MKLPKLRGSPVLIRLAFVCCLGALLSAGCGYLYVGTIVPGLPASISTSCGPQNEAASASPSCEALIQDLGVGRWRLLISGHAGAPVKIVLKLRDPDAGAGALLLRLGIDRSGRPSTTQATLQRGGSYYVLSRSGDQSGLRGVLTLPPSTGSAVELTAQVENSADADKLLVFDEIGLFRHASDINSVFGFQIRPDWKPSVTLVMRLLVLAAIVLSLRMSLSAAYAIPRMRRWAAVECGLIIGLAAISILLRTNGPEWSDDLRVMIASTLLDPPGSNLNYGMYMADSILQGHGPLIRGTVVWNRMPGYPYLLALSLSPGDLLTIGLRSIFLQIAVNMIGVAVLALTLARMIRPWIAVLVGGLLAVLPATPYYTYLDSAMPGIACLTIAAACNLLIAEETGRGNRLLPHLLLHAAFALWFSFRVDVLPGWAIVTLILYAWPPRRWMLAALPIALFLAIGLPWAFFKRRYTGEFSMTTESAGASLMVGLWEIPHPFIWKADEDATYFGWARSNGFNPISKAASDWAVHEVVRFWLTYPGYVVALIWNKFMRFIFEYTAPGQPVLGRLTFTGIVPLFCIGVMAVGAAARYTIKRIVLPGWIILFNIPIFFIVYSSTNRFYNTALPSLFVATALLLADSGFYRRIAGHLRPAAIAAVFVLGIALFGPSLAQWLSHSDELEFGIHLADPEKSTLVRRP